jgi:DegV family protein with EDD domain
LIAIVTDSTAYLTKKRALDADVRVVPANYVVSGKSFSESYSGNNGDYLSLLTGAKNLTTSQASVAAFMSVFEELLRNGYQILCIVMSSRLSGMYSSASIAAREVDKENIIVVDSLTIAGGMEFLITKAREFIDAGLSLNEVAVAVEKERERVGIVFSVDDLEALRRSGRVGHVLHSIGAILNLRPILVFEDGAVISSDTARGTADQIRKLTSKIPDNAKEVTIHYIKEQAHAVTLFYAIRKRFPMVKLKMVEVGPVLGIHLGLSVIAAAWITE